MHYALRIVLHPASSVAVACVIWSLIMHTTFAAKVLLVFFGALVYMFLRPGARRNALLWRALAPLRASSSLPVGGAGGNSRGSTPRSPLDDLKGNCIIVSIPVSSALDVLDHALAFGGDDASVQLSYSTVMYVCRTSTERTMFWLPLARLALWLLGGLMEYSRGLLLQLLKRKSGRPLVAIVLLPPAVRSAGGTASTSSCAVLNIQQKGIFAASLKTGATVIPCLVLEDGTVTYGKRIDPPSTANQLEGVAVPSPDQVRRLSTAFSEELSILYKNVTGTKLRVQ
jgi:hypothetical protein